MFGDAINSFLNVATREGTDIFTENKLIPSDSTRAVIGKAQPLEIGTASPTGGNSGTPGAVLAYLQVQRFVGKIPVVGMGSRELIGLDTQGNVNAFVQSWKTAMRFKTVHDTMTKAQVCTAINNQLKSLNPVSARLLNASLVYYGVPTGTAGVGAFNTRRFPTAVEYGFLVPAVQFTAQVSFDKTTAKQLNAPDVIQGYVGIGKQYAKLPGLKSTNGSPPMNDSSPTTGRRSTRAAVPNGDPCVGRYVVRNDDPGWVNDANSFWGGMLVPVGWLHFSNCQSTGASLPVHDPEGCARQRHEYHPDGGARRLVGFHNPPKLLRQRQHQRRCSVSGLWRLR